MHSTFRVYIYLFAYVGLSLLTRQSAGARILSSTVSDSGLIVRQYAIAVPLLKGVSSGPVHRMEIRLSETAGARSLGSVECQLGNDADAGKVGRIELWMSDTASFEKARLIGSVDRPEARVNFTPDVRLKAGTYYCWVVLKPSESAATGDEVAFTLRQVHFLKVRARGSKPGRRAEGFVYAEPYRHLSVGTAVRRAGDDGVHTYRIPGIVETDKGTLLAVYDIRYLNTRDLPGHVDVGLNRSTDGGRSWSPMRVIMDMGAPHENNGVGDPTILFDPATKRIIVAALWSKGNRSIAGSKPGLSPDTTGQFVLAHSDDDGLTWSAPYSITPQVKEPRWHLFFQGPGNGIAMQDGRLVFPAQYWDENRMPYSTIIWSEDHGASWKGRVLGPKSNTTESQVVETRPGALMLNMRDNRGKFRSVSTTTDMGATWNTHPTSYSALPDPVCMGSLIKAKVRVKGELRDVLFFSNPNTSAGRHHITIQASLDLGETWQPANKLLVDERECFGYSSLVTVGTDRIGILYEGIRDLYFVTYPVDSIIK
jgi:sialidase-1